MARMPATQSPSPSHGACSAFKRHRRHLRQMRLLHLVLRGQKLPVQPPPNGSMPPDPVPVYDLRFLALLGNTNVMGGSLEQGQAIRLCDPRSPAAPVCSRNGSHTEVSTT